MAGVEAGIGKLRRDLDRLEGPAPWTMLWQLPDETEEALRSRIDGLRQEQPGVRIIVVSMDRTSSETRYDSEPIDDPGEEDLESGDDDDEQADL